MKKIISILSLSALTFATACAEKSENIQGTYVSPMQYSSFSCNQLAAEGQRISARAAQVAGVQDKNAKNDAALTATALILFWPAAFFIKGDNENAAELSRLKGELDAVEQRAIEKNCNIDFQRS